MFTLRTIYTTAYPYCSPFLVRTSLIVNVWNTVLGFYCALSKRPYIYEQTGAIYSRSVLVNNVRSPRCLGKACCQASGLWRVGWVFVAGVRPDSPSTSDPFLMLRVAARLRRGSRVGSYVARQARTPTIRASFFRQQRQHSIAQSGCPCAEAGATTGHTTAKSNCAGRRLDSTTKEEGDRASTSGEKTD